MRKSGLTGDEAYALSKRRGTSGDLGPLKKELSLLKEDLSNKITKFYASNQGETHLADSDNGKIQDMMLYGKSEQFTTIGKNLLKIKDRTQTSRGITVIAKDGVVALKGTATESGWAILTVDSFVLDGVYILSSNISSNVGVKVVDKSFRTVLEQGKSVTLENVEASRVCFVVTEGETYDISNILIQIEKGSVATSYEPYTGGIPSPNPSYPQEIKSVVNPIVKLSNEDGTQFETVTLPYTLNAIPVSSGGNVTINGQQYIADYVDVERGKLVRMCKYKKLLSADIEDITSKKVMYINTDEIWDAEGNYTSRRIDMLCSAAIAVFVTVPDSGWGGKGKIIIENVQFTHIDEAKNYFNNNDVYACYPIPMPEEIPITLEEASAFKQLMTYYPVTNITVSSEQLDGYTVFNYPISMANGWNYVKQQLNDNRDYIYDMDLQSAEAYVNSEYAVALTELEV